MRLFSKRMSQRLSKETGALALILLLAGFLRFYQIDRVPPGLHFDEAFNIFDIFNLLQGQFSIFFPANFGREALYLYTAMVGGALFGDQPLTLRLTSAIIGTATILMFYAFARSLFRSTRIAALAALLLAISVWHIYYSRLGLRVVLAVPLTLLSLFWFWRGLTLTQSQIPFSPENEGEARAIPSLTLRRQRRSKILGAERRGGRDGVGVGPGVTSAFALAGLFTSLTVYTYTSGRLLPIIFAILTICAIVLDRPRWRSYVLGLVISGIVALVVFAPLGWYFYIHPEDFGSHGSNLSIWDPRVNGGDLIGTFRTNLVAVAGMFLVRGDKEAFRNVPFHPVFDPLIGVFFLGGLLLLLAALLSPRSSKDVRLRAILIVAGLIVLIAPSVLSDAPPNFTRTLPAAPLLILIPAWAMSTLWDAMPSLSLRRLTTAATGIILLASGLQAYDDYFVRFANSSALYYAFDVRMFDVAQWIKQNATTSQIYMAPLWYQNGTLLLLTRNAHLKSFESRDTIVLPGAADGKDALYAFPMEQATKADKLGERLGSLATREIMTGSTGEQLLVVYHIRAGDLPAAQNPPATLARGGAFVQPQTNSRVDWNGQIQLLGYTLSPEGPGGRNLTVTLFFQALQRMPTDSTFSLKVRDDQGRVWGQEDKWPGDNSYATSQWSAGEVIVEKFYPGLAACAPAGEYHVSVEAYDPKTMQTLPVTQGQDAAISVGTFQAGPSEGNRFEDLEPEQGMDAEVAPQVRLIGWTLEPHEVHAGDPLSLSLFWRGSGSGLSRRIQIRSGSATLAEREISVPAEGRGICTLFDLTAPANLPAGENPLFVNDVKITSLNVVR
jgi:4-amino-4-deoxy-L-arabinose transferase-like glycosyltransferase